jgi:hypothetical protein
LAAFNTSEAQGPFADAIRTAETIRIAEAPPTKTPYSVSATTTGDTQATTEVTNDTWKVGELVMAQWSRDRYWYPARIEEQVGDQFEIRHLDGTEDTVTADKLAKDSLQEGDRVSVDWQRKGRYFWGKVVSRQGDKLRILYDEQGEEDTTIAAVRFWPEGELLYEQDTDEHAYYTSTPARNYAAEFQAYQNAEAQLHRMHAANARQQEANIRAEAQQMQDEIMNREYYNGLNRLNNAVPGFQPFPYSRP